MVIYTVTNVKSLNVLVFLALGLSIIFLAFSVQSERTNIVQVAYKV